MPPLAPTTTIRLPASMSLLCAAHDDRGIVTAEAVRSTEHVTLLEAARVPGHIIEVARRIRVVEVHGGMHEARVHAGERRHGFDRARGGDEVSDQRFGRGNGQRARSLAEYAVD